VAKWARRGCIALFASALLPVPAGVAGAVPKSLDKEIDGYRVTLLLENVAIQSVPNMAGAPFVREGFITASSRLEIVCNLGECKAPMPRAKMEMSAQIGCPMDVSGGVTTSLTPQLNGSLPFQDILAAILPPPTPVPTPGPGDFTDVAILPNGSISPNAGVSPLPGYIRNVSLGVAPAPTEQPDVALEIQKLSAQIKKLSDQMQNIDGLKSGDQTPKYGGEQKIVGDQIRKPSAATYPLSISVQNFHMEVDQTENKLASCGGTVAIRIVARADVDTDDSTETIDIYGDVYTL
jgi:hypothetical protein